MSRRTLAVALLILAVVVAGLLARWASDQPDGLEKTLADLGRAESDPAAAPAPLPDYAVPGVSAKALSLGLAGIIGVVITLAVTFAVGKLLAARPRTHQAEQSH